MADIKVKCSGCGHMFGLPKGEEGMPCPKCGRIVSQLDSMVDPHLVELIMIALREDISRIPVVFHSSACRALGLEQPEILRGFLDAIPGLLGPQCSPDRRHVVAEECVRLQRALRRLQEQEDQEKVQDWCARKDTLTEIMTSERIDASVLKTVILSLMDADYEVHKAAERALQKIDPNWPESEAAALAVPQLVAGLDYTINGYTFFGVVAALRQIKDRRSVEPLITAAGRVTGDLRARAIEALGEIRDNRAVPFLIASLRDVDPRIREASAWALGKIGDERAVSALMFALEDTSDRTRWAAEWSLANMANVATEPLKTASRDGSDAIRAEALKVLGDIGGLSVCPTLIMALYDQHWLVPIRAWESLKKITGQDFGKDPAAWTSWLEENSPNSLTASKPSVRNKMCGTG